MSHDQNRLDRRHFLKSTAVSVGAAAVAGPAVLGADQKQGAPEVQVDAKDLIWRGRNVDMAYARMGRTNFMVSRIVQGWGGNETLWRRLLARGVNYIDAARGYGNFELELKPFLQKQRDKLWLTSKATDVAGYSKIDDEVAKLYRAAMKDYLGNGEGDLLALHKKAVEKQKQGGDKPDLRPAGKRMAKLYREQLDDSLGRLGVKDVDAYFMHGIEIPWIFDCLEVWEAYENAHKAGKAKHFGFSTHNHQKEVLAAAVEANAKGPWKIDVIMPGVNPESFDALKPELTSLKKQDVGLIAMKTSGIKNRPVDGREKKFESLVGGKSYNEWERAKLWMLNLTDGLIDAVIMQIKSNEEMEKDLPLASLKLTADAQRELRTLVKYEMAGACHLCGDCTTVCPEHIAVTNMIRYHAYTHQYSEQQLARELYARAGYDPARVCRNCGRCAEVCPSDVRIVELLHELSADMTGVRA
ncbi:MAG: aldo/keto reductase [Phycisphaerae bacterium]|nr:aldo/keto reductase [Phycisphaerae bacterium]